MLITSFVTNSYYGIIGKVKKLWFIVLLASSCTLEKTIDSDEDHTAENQAIDYYRNQRYRILGRLKYDYEDKGKLDTINRKDIYWGQCSEKYDTSFSLLKNLLDADFEEIDDLKREISICHNSIVGIFHDYQIDLAGIEEGFQFFEKFDERANVKKLLLHYLICCERNLYEKIRHSVKSELYENDWDRIDQLAIEAEQTILKKDSSYRSTLYFVFSNPEKTTVNYDLKLDGKTIDSTTVLSNLPLGRHKISGTLYTPKEITWGNTLETEKEFEVIDCE